MGWSTLEPQRYMVTYEYGPWRGADFPKIAREYFYHSEEALQRYLDLRKTPRTDDGEEIREWTIRYNTSGWTPVYL